MTRRPLAAFGALVGLTCAALPGGPAAAQNTSRLPPTAATNAPITIAGRVVDAVTGAPVADAMITVECSRGPSRELANADGRFVFRDLPRSDFILTVKADGYTTESGGEGEPPNPDLFFNLAEGQQKNLTVRLWKPAALSGHVYGAAGEPVVGVDVWLLSVLHSQLSGAGNPVATDDRGAFRFSSLEPGTYFVGIRGFTLAGPMRPSLSGTDGQVLAVRKTFYPGTASFANAQAVSLRAGDDRSDLDFQFSPMPTANVSGTVTDSSGPVTRLTLDLTPDIPGWELDTWFPTDTTTTDASGAFTFVGVPPGHYTISGTQAIDGPPRSVRWVRTPLTVGTSTVQGISLMTHAPLRVAGHVQFSGSAPPTLEELGSLRLRLERPISSSLDPAGHSVEIGLNADGSFAVEGLVPARYGVSFTGSDDWVVRSIVRDSIETADASVDVSTSVRDVRVAALHKSGLAEITGVVRSDGSTGVPGLVVAIPAEAAPPNAWKGYDDRAMLEPDHSYVLKGLLPGDYFIAALSLDDARQGWDSPEIVATLIGRATRVSLNQGSRRVLDLTPVRIR